MVNTRRLQCADATVHNALVDVVKRPAMRVGIMGIDGYISLSSFFLEWELR